MNNMEKSEFEKNEIVWHRGFKKAVKFLSVLKPRTYDKGVWYYIQLQNGGFMETQHIEKLTTSNAEKDKDGIIRLTVKRDNIVKVIPFNEAVNQAKVKIVKEAIDQAGGNVSKAAEMLKIDRKTIYNVLNPK